MANELIETRTAKIRLGDDGIVYKVFKDSAQETLADALESAEVIAKLCQDGKKPMLVDFTPVRSMDGDARAYYSGPEASAMVSAVAGVTGSLIGKVIGNFFIGFNKPSTPGKIFNAQGDALEWLKQYR